MSHIFLSFVCCPFPGDRTLSELERRGISVTLPTNNFLNIIYNLVHFGNKSVAFQFNKQFLLAMTKIAISKTKWHSKTCKSLTTYKNWQQNYTNINQTTSVPTSSATINVQKFVVVIEAVVNSHTIQFMSGLEQKCLACHLECSFISPVGSNEAAGVDKDAAIYGRLLTESRVTKTTPTLGQRTPNNTSSDHH